MLENGGLALISFSALIIYSRFLSVSDFGCSRSCSRSSS
jgi:hypothetical protein